MLEKEKPPIFGMLQRGGEVVIRKLANVKQVTISPLIKRSIAQRAVVHTDDYDMYAQLPEWGFTHRTVCHAAGEFARGEDGDGFCEVHVNTLERFWSLLHIWLQPHQGISQDACRCTWDSSSSCVTSAGEEKPCSGLRSYSS